MANLHIDQIAEESGIDLLPNQETISVSRNDLEYFAKAVLDNCFTVLEDSIVDSSNLNDQAGAIAIEQCLDKLKRHFGI